MTLWELAACVDGFNRANSAPGITPPTDKEFDDMVDRHGLKDKAD